MKKVHMVLIELFVYLVLLIYILVHPYFSYSRFNDEPLRIFPVEYWIVFFVSSALTGILSYRSNKGYITVLSGLLYGFLFYITNLYFIIPYEQVENVFPSSIIEFILSSSKITPKVLSIHSLSYLSYPISFLLEKAIMLASGIGKISIYTVGLFAFMGIFYIGLIYYYYEHMKNAKFAVVSFSIYIVLSFYVINDQVAPQTLALIFLPYLYGITFQFIENQPGVKMLLIVIILWFALVFTHPFMFLFYMLPVVGTILYFYITKSKIPLKSSTLGLLISLWGLGFIWSFYLLLSIPLSRFIDQWGEVEGETWWIFARFLKKPEAFGPVKYSAHPHYELVSKWVVQLQAWFLRVILTLLLLLVTYQFIKHLTNSVRTRTVSHQLILDASVIISSGILFGIGLVTNFLGQRVFQVMFIPLSRYFKLEKNKWFSGLILFILIIAPFAYTFNSLTNLTVGPQLFIQDEQLLRAGYFGNTYLPQNSKVVSARELYPSEYPAKIRVFSFPGGILKWPTLKWDYLYYSKKFKHASEYYGIGNYGLNIEIYSDTVYTTGTVWIKRRNPL